MASDKEIEAIERRAELAVKVSALEERSLATQKQLGGLENVLSKHATDEEQMLRDISQSIRDAKSDIDETIDSKIDKKLEPIKEEIRDAKTVLKVIAVVASFIGSIIALSWDNFVHWLLK